jgi:hypothetical protein
VVGFECCLLNVLIVHLDLVVATSQV